MLAMDKQAIISSDNRINVKMSLILAFQNYLKSPKDRLNDNRLRKPLRVSLK